MRDGKNYFYRQLRVDRVTRKAIRLFNKVKYIMMSEIENKKEKDGEQKSE